MVEATLLERCDGNRNILHASVSMCYPVSAHDQSNTSDTSKGANSSAGIGTKLDSIKGAVDALAAAVAAAAAAVRSNGSNSGEFCQEGFSGIR